MLQPVSVALKYGFLIVLYLFLAWVAASALLDLRRVWRRPARDADELEGTSIYATADPLAAYDERFEPRLVVTSAPGYERGVAYDLSEGATLGRGDAAIPLYDPFASAQHARITRQGVTMVIEDLGSTNGTYLNGQLLTGAQPLHKGDLIRIGDSEFSYQR